jgi:hypothetical protein
MVSGYFRPGRVRVSLSAAGGHRLRANRGARLLRVDDLVRLNLRNAWDRRDRSPGVILDITGDTARVRWIEGLAEQHVELRHLIRA